jgi:hypothetical protein
MENLELQVRVDLKIIEVCEVREILRRESCDIFHDLLMY